MKKIFLLAVATFILAACDTGEDKQPSSNEAAKITATIGERDLSRAADTKWAAGDSIGILSTIGTDDDNQETGPFKNFKYTTDGTGNFTGSPIFFYKPMTLIAYYPFTGEQGVIPGTNGVIKNIRTDADNQSSDKQPLIDFLWDSRKDKTDFSVNDPNVNFIFTHKMSKLSFVFQGSTPVVIDGITISDGVDVHTMVSYGIEGLGIEGSFDTATGICAIDDETDREELTISCERQSTDGLDYNFKRYFPSLIVFPQKAPEGGFTLHIATDELNNPDVLQKYKCRLRFTDDEIKPGCHYIFNIQVTRRGLIVGNLTIEPWAERPENEKFFVATIDGNEEEQQQD